MKHVSALFRLLRPHQWTKNLLILLPPLLADAWGTPGLPAAAALSFLCFSLCASSVYILNDWVDREADRLHPTKKNRPLAAGDVSPTAAFLTLFLLLAGVFGITCYVLPPGFGLVLAVYLAGNLLYSFRFKHEPILDVVFLTLMYVLRVIAGGQGTGIPITGWLLSISLFLFLSLAFGKRFQELHLAVEMRADLERKIRGYYPDDLPLVRTFGQGSGLICVLLVALYVQSPEIGPQFQSPQLLWLLCPLLLYGLGRFWLIAERGQMRSDPLKFVLKDGPSVAVFFLILLTIRLALRLSL